MTYLHTDLLVRQIGHPLRITRIEQKLFTHRKAVMSTYIKTTEDGRKVEVIGQAIYLAGKKEATELVNVYQHPNGEAILKAVPNATHVAGRLPLTAEETALALAAINEAKAAYDNSELGITQRMRKSQRGAMENRIEE